MRKVVKLVLIQDDIRENCSRRGDLQNILTTLFWHIKEVLLPRARVFSRSTLRNYLQQDEGFQYMSISLLTADICGRMGY